MKLLLATYSSSPHTHGDYDFAIIDMTEELAKKIRVRQQFLKMVLEKDADLAKLEFADDSAQYFQRDPDLEEGDDKVLIEAMFDALQNSGCVEIIKKALPEEYFQEDEDLQHEMTCPRMVVSPDGVFWAAYPDTDEGVEITTHSLPEQFLTQIL